MKVVLSILITLAILGGSVFAARTIISNRPEPRQRPNFDIARSVDAVTVKRSDYQVTVLSQGAVEPSRSTALVPEVSGIIRTLSSNLVPGGYFNKGDLLLQIDDRDYQIALAQANAQRAQALAALQEEQARSSQARADWKSLGRKGSPSALTARTPQLAAARANLEAADAQVGKAELDLERTRIIAPYDGRVATVSIDEGEFVNRGAGLAEIYSTASALVRLPLSTRQLTHLKLPASGTSGTAVTLSATIGSTDAQWPATIVRSEGIDTNSQQLTVVAEIINPLSNDEGRTPLRIGQFVEASIVGDLLEDVVVIPRASLRQNNEVLLVDGESRVKRQVVEVAWTDTEQAAIQTGLDEGDTLMLTALGSITDGTLVRATIDGKAPPPPRMPGGFGGQRGGQRGGPQGGTQEGNGGQQRGGPGSGNTPQAGGPASGQGGNPDARLQRLKSMIDAGGDLPPPARERLQQRLDAGEKLPDWVVKALRSED